MRRRVALVRTCALQISPVLYCVNPQPFCAIAMLSSYPRTLARAVSRAFSTLPTPPTAPSASARSIYLDLQATTPLDPRVLDAMLPFQTELYGNPHSRTHEYGWEAEEAVEIARKQVADIIGADKREIIFTSGATESNNAIIKGIARFYSGRKRHIITTQTEHKCVLDSCRRLSQDGFEVTYLPVDSDGLVSLSALEEAIRPGETSLVSIMLANNEIGVLQPVAEIGALCRRHKVFFHTDAAQAVGKVDVDVNAMNIDALSLSGHKVYGPKGVGAMYVRRRPRVRMDALINGGGQERGLRSGTLPTPLIVGLGAACALAQREMSRDTAHTASLAARLRDRLLTEIPSTTLNGHATQRLAGSVNVSFGFVEGESLLMALKGIAVSSGSACTSASLEPSYVLRALGVDEELAHTSIRFGVGRFTTVEEVDYAVEWCKYHVARLRELSPLWEMHLDGVDLKAVQWSQH